MREGVGKAMREVSHACERRDLLEQHRNQMANPFMGSSKCKVSNLPTSSRM